MKTGEYGSVKKANYFKVLDHNGDSFKIEVNDDDISKDSATDPLQFLSSDIDKEENLDDEHKDSSAREEKIVDESNYSNGDLEEIKNHDDKIVKAEIELELRIGL